MHIDDALSQFLTQLEADGRSIHTCQQYTRHVRALSAWAGPERTLESIAHQDIAGFMSAPVARTRLDGRIKKANSVNALRTSLRMFLKFCHDAGWILENPARLLRPAICGRPLPRALTEDEASRLIGAITHPRDHAFFATLLATGIRIGSALALDVADLDLERGEILLRRAKGDRVERVYVTRTVREVLVAFVAGRTTGPLFQIGARHAHRRLAHWLKVAGITRPASPHSLRHSFATHLLKKSGGDIMLVQKALRHRNIESTLRYAALDDQRVREAIEA